MCVFFIILYHYENIGHYSLGCFVAFYLGVCVCKPGSQQPRESWPVQGSILQADHQTESQLIIENVRMVAVRSVSQECYI